MLSNNKKYKIVVWSTSSLERPRIKIILQGLKNKQYNILYCNKTIWDDLKSKHNIRGLNKITFLILRHVWSYLLMIVKYLSLPKHDYILVPYMGQFDLLIIKPFAIMRNVQIVCDFYISLHDTMVDDRRLIKKRSFLSKIIYIIEWVDTRLANIIFMDTYTHAKFIKSKFKLTKNVEYIYVGAEPIFNINIINDTKKDKNGSFTILFYGHLSPLHGIDIIVKAASILEYKQSGVRFILIGEGQESNAIDQQIKKLQLKTITRYSYVSYNSLPEWINKADVCLGIFSMNAKVDRVIPNKIFQYLSMNKIIITASSMALRELSEYFKLNKIFLIEPGNENQLANTISYIKKHINTINTIKNDFPRFNYHDVANQFDKILFKK